MHTPPTIRLHLFFARAAPRILIVRRGPTRVFHLVLWDTATDTFEHGSWFRGSLYLSSCDLSRDGQWLVYFALGPTRQHWSWTAVARPPWLRATLFYPQDNTWGGGGSWVGPGRLWLGVDPDSLRPGDATPASLGLRLAADDPLLRRYRRPFFARMERDGWRRAGSDPQIPTVPSQLGWPVDDRDGWVLQPRPDLPALRLFYQGYFFNRGDVYRYALDGYPTLIDGSVDMAGYDHAGRLVVARGGAIERYTTADLAHGAPSFRHDLSGLVPPPRPPPRPAATHTAIAAPAPVRGPDAAGQYPYLGPFVRRAAAGKAGTVLRSPADLAALAPQLRAADGWDFDQPLIYVVTPAETFVVGGALADEVDLNAGAPVLAAGEATVAMQPDGSWAIVALNNRSYSYMPGPESWVAVARALTLTGIAFPKRGFSEIYPLEGTWDEVLEELRG